MGFTTSYPTRRLLALLAAVSMILSLMALYAGPAAGQQQDQQGTVKIHDGNTEPDPEPQNEPTVGCDFHLHGDNFNANEPIRWWIEEWPGGDQEYPTDDDVLTNSVTADSNGDWRDPVSGTHSLPDVNPSGVDYRLFWDAEDEDIDANTQPSTKHKNFKVECAPTTTTTTTVADTTTTTAQATTTTISSGFGSIFVTKTAGADTVVSGSQVTFTVEVENTSDVGVTIDTISDNVFGEIAPSASADVVSTDCLAPQALAPSDGIAGSGDDFYSCQFVAVVEGEAGTPHVNTVTVSGTDEFENPVSDSDDAIVGFDEVAGIVVTTTTVASTPTTAAVTPIVTTEVLDVQIEAEELPFTGMDTPFVLGLALLLLASGGLILRLGSGEEG